MSNHYDSNLGIDNVVRFDSNKKTYIRVDIKRRKVNLSDLMDMINDNLTGKDWNYNNCKFETRNPLPDSGKDEWVVFIEPNVDDEE